MRSRSLTGAVLLLITIILAFVAVAKLYNITVTLNKYCSNAITLNNHCQPEITSLNGGTESTDTLHLTYLSSTEREQFDRCAENAKTISRYLYNGTCHFMNGTGRQPVALASFPGSGNTWVRGLLQKATGICTGAIYCDRFLRLQGFPGEAIRGSSVLVVKTHNKARKQTEQYGSAILIVRNPKDALIAEWHRRRAKQVNLTVENKHVLSVGKENFGTNEDWNNFVKNWSSYWKEFIESWAEFGEKWPLLVVYYEDLKTQSAEEVSKMLNFLGFSNVHEQTLLEDTQFHRKQHDDFGHFTPDQKIFLNRIIISADTTLERDRFSLVDRYLSS